MDTRFYDRYNNLLSKLDYSYKGYNLKNLVPGYLTCMFTDDPLTGRDVFKGFYQGVQFVDVSKVLQTDKSTVISYLIDRKDYGDLAESVKKLYPDSGITCIETLGHARYSVFSISYIGHLLKAFRIVFTRSIKESFTTKLFLVALLTNLLNQVKYLERIKCPANIKRYICFNSAYKEESLLTLYFKKRGIETITLQHGIFCDFKQIIPFDIINLDNLIANKVMCWGQSTVDYLKTKGFDDSRLMLMGNPKYKDAVITHVDQSFTKCLVLLGRSVYIPSNDKLLALLQEFNRKHNNRILFYLKKHPFVVDSEHKAFASLADNMFFVGREHSVQEVLRSDLVDFTIAVNTTAYYESLALGKISLRWSESENEDFVGMDDKFYDLKGLEEKIEVFKSKPEPEIRQEMKDVIKYVFNPDLK
ncbi:hypothetical protein [Dysgonomonas macrotermitis]|uniref:CDP-Glycerol:Poly(Glycerophosphate) glycerophosphotransferase n=1 Tax=Dysgonomonas macrotermitis TaxID=1346286 RepID=A0A1M4UBW5_9BACT|nr:hypothetical protein [Dysgonomonas macrotermitis]SHE54108.1 hypothetical protein SAMN05444362_101556 [Dysgonomonas macrotermitis]